MGLPRYSRNKKMKKKRWGFGLQVHEPSKPESPSLPSEQQRLLRPSFFRPDRSNGRSTTRHQPPRSAGREKPVLEDDDRHAIAELRKLLQRSLHNDSERLDMLVNLLVASGIQPQWHEAEGKVAAHWQLRHDQEAVEGIPDDEDDEDEEDPVVRQDEPQEDPQAPA